MKKENEEVGWGSTSPAQNLKYSNENIGQTCAVYPSVLTSLEALTPEVPIGRCGYAAHVKAQSITLLP